ncbi:MAG: C10 family peptidase [Bacteroidales bacterium]|nr:C10 family peptidase [Bacteroidales bacterium]
MKKLLLFLTAAALCATTGAARSLSPDEALSRLTEGRASKALSRNPVGSARLITTGTYNNVPTYYVFAQGERTLFVGADDLAEPLLGYVDNPDFNVDNMPPQMKWWLSEYSREIEYATARQAKGVQARAKVENPNMVSLAKKEVSATRSAISPLCATTWDQAAPYNNLCPLKSNQRTYTGCVATAMAQVMKYHSYPTKGAGSNSYTWNNQTLSMTFSSVTFDWANMLNTYPSSTSGTSAQRTAIATLMKACGYSVDMEYGIDSDGGSGATSFVIAPALVNNFSYDKGTHTEFRDYYSEAEWEEMMYDNLKNVGPIVYCGASNQGGHCFVCDGYNTSGYFHINWGWSGSYDGYFKLSALNPDGQGIGGYAGGYNTQQDATLGIRKPVSGSVLPESYLAIEGSLTATASSKTLTFKATNGGFYNMSSYAASFTPGVELTSSDGKVSYVSGSSLGSVKPGYGTGSISVSLSSVSAGTYAARLVYKVGSGSWKRMKYVYGNPSYVNITVTSSGITVGSKGTDSGSSSTTTDEGQVSVTSMTCTPTSPVIGESVSVKATFKNTYTSSQTVSATAYLCTKGSSSYSVAATIQSQSVTISKSATKSVTFSGTVSSSLSAGTYYLLIADGDGYIISDAQEVSVVASSGTTTGEVSVTSMTCTPTSPVIGESVSVKATFKNTYTTSKTLTANAYLCTKGSSSYSIAATIQSQSVTISKSATKSVTFSGTVSSSLSAGTYYLLIADSDGNIISDVQEVSVVASSGTTTGEVSVTSMTCTPSSPVIGESVSVKATFKNTYTSSKTVSAKALLCSKSTSGYSIKATLQTQSVTISKSATKSVTFTGTVPSSLTAGTYYLIIADSDNNMLSSAQEVSVVAASSTTGEISVTSVSSSTGFTQGQACKVSAVVKNTYSSTQSVTVQAYLCTLSGSSYTIKASLGSTSVSVSANSTRTATISTTLSESLAVGSYYLVICDGDNTILNTPETVDVKAAAAASSSTLGINSVTTSTGFTAGSTCTLKVTFANSGTSTVSTSVTPTFYTLSGSTYTKVATLPAKSVSVTRGSTKSVSFSSTLSSALASGTYYLKFIDASGNVVGNKVYSLSVTGKSSYARYTVRGFSMHDAEGVDADNARFDLQVEAVAEDVNEQFVALIYPENIFDGVEVGMAMFERKPVYAGETENFTFFGAIGNLVPGKKYRAVLFSLSGDSFFSGFDYVDNIPFTVKDMSGVTDLEAAESENVEYYDLKGVKVAAENLKSGIYIKVSDGKAEKVYVK